MTTPHAPTLELTDLHPPADDLQAEVVAGLSADPKRLPCKFLYDEYGSQLFDRICELQEYYPTRTELAIMEAHGAEMADALGPHCLLVEYGSGASRKIRVLLDHLHDPAGYMPVDISRDFLLASAESLAADYPDLPILPVCADYTNGVRLPSPPRPADRWAVYFAGSTIGNFERARAEGMLRRIAAKVGPGGGLLIGVDLKKDPAILRAAYNDREGVTAAFNLNLLTRINRELGGDFDYDAFEHRAVWNERLGRIEMHLVSLADQRVALGDGSTFDFAACETIHTESSHKFTLDGFAELAGRAGFAVEKVWTDPDELFSVQYLTVE